MDQWLISWCPRENEETGEVCEARVRLHTWEEGRPWGSTTAYEKMGEILDADCQHEWTDAEVERIWENAEPDE